MKPATIFLAFVLVIGGILSARAGTSVTALLSIGNAVPVVSSVSINNNAATITLTAATTTNVNVTAIVSDNNGCSDLTGGTTTILLYRSGVSSSSCMAGTGAAVASLNCYTATAFTASSTCTGTGTSVNMTTTFPVAYYAQATDASSSFPNTNWLATVLFTDPSSTTGSADSTHATSSNVMSTLTAVNVGTQSSVSFNNTNTAVDVASTPLSTPMSVTAGGMNTVAVACVTYDEGVGMSISSISYGGHAMTSAGTVASSGDLYAEAYYLVNPPTGSNTLLVSVSGAINDIYANLVSFNGVNQTTPIRPGTYVSTTTTGGGFTWNIPISSNPDDLTMTCIDGGTNGGAVTTNQTLDGENQGGASQLEDDHATTPSSTVTHSWFIEGGFNTAVGFSIQGIIATSTISYGTLAPSSTTGSADQTVAVQNVGNSSSSLNLSGTALANGGNTIATSSQHFATSTFTFGGTEQLLSGTAATVSGFLLTGPTSTANVQSSIYWGLQVPNATASGTYNGTNTFTAVFHA